MFKYTTSPRATRWDRVIWAVLSPILVSILLLANFTANETLASSDDLASEYSNSSLALQDTTTPTPTLQIETTPTLQDAVSTSTPSPQIEATPAAQDVTVTLTSTQQLGSTSTFDFSFATLGYGEATLASPFASAKYSFNIPEDWVIQGEGVLDLDLSYVYSQIRAEDIPALFGDLTVAVNGQTVEIFPIETEKLDHYRLPIPLPASLLASSNNNVNIELLFDASLLCAIPHQAALVIHPTSSVSLSYSQGSILPDISQYPQPFRQRAFEPDAVRFVLPSQPTSNDLTSAAGVVAKLGNLTNNRVAISATTDLDLSSLLQTVSETFDEHLIVIGQPEDNQLLPLLDDATDLPVSLHERQLTLITQGPEVIEPGETFTYIFTVTNTLEQAIDLSLIDSLPSHTILVDCADCIEDDGRHAIAWNNNTLAPDETLNLSLTLKATDTLTTGITLENTMTLVETDLGPLNADTLTSTSVTDTAGSHAQISIAAEDGYFFIYNDQAVAKGDGIIQEIVSPWSQRRAILVITGLSDEAVRKAAQAMSSETRFPGMSGSVALVRNALHPSEINDPGMPAIQTTFAGLGYGDELIRGESTQETNYVFEVPSSWQLTEDAAIDLYFNHSQLIDYTSSALNVLLNNNPVATVALNDETSSRGHLHVSLADASIQTGEENRLTVQPELTPLRETECSGGIESFWFLTKNTSELFLPHNEVPASFTLDLIDFPVPFQTNRSLTNLLFVLPDTPVVSELEALLRLAANLGDSVTGKTIAPEVVISSDLQAQDLTKYHIIAVGRPSRNPLLQQVNDQLPQPFLPGSDEIEQWLDDVVLRLPPDVVLGYIQLIASPWNENRAFLAITGTQDEGVQQATQTIINRSSRLQGNLALIKEDQTTTIDTRQLTSAGLAAAVATAVPEITPLATETVASEATSTSSAPTPTLDNASTQQETSEETSLPAWLLPLVGVNGLIVVAILAFAFWQARRRRS